MNNCERIRIDCYLAVLEKFKILYDQAVFEIITRKVILLYMHKPSALSPAWELIDTMKQEDWSMQKYYQELEEQFSNDLEAQSEIERLRGIVKSGKTLFLVCFEKDASQCHRTLVKQLLERGL